MTNPLISLIIPVYNVNPKFLEECIESVNAQTLQKSLFEVIVFDDGSAFYSDETRKFAGSVGNSRYFRREQNKGPALTRNQAINESRGRLIVLLDADDILSGQSLEETLKFMEFNRKVKYSYSMHRVVDKEGKFIEDLPCKPYDSELLLHTNFVGHIKCFDREIHLRLGGYDSEMLFAEDWDHALKASELLKPEQFMQNPQYLYLYIIHGTNMTLDRVDKLMAYRSKVITAALKRRGFNARAFFSHTTGDGYAYMDW